MRVVRNLQAALVAIQLIQLIWLGILTLELIALRHDLDIQALD